jgi:hypothetical protein
VAATSKYGKIIMKKFIMKFIQTYIIEELRGSVNVRSFENPDKILGHYDTIFVPTVGSFVVMGWINKKEYKVIKVVYTYVGNIATIYVNE